MGVEGLEAEAGSVTAKIGHEPLWIAPYPRRWLLLRYIHAGIACSGVVAMAHGRRSARRIEGQPSNTLSQ